MEKVVCKGCGNQYEKQFGLCPICGVEVGKKKRFQEESNSKNRIKTKKSIHNILFGLSCLVVVSGIILYFAGYFDLTIYKDIKGEALSNLLDQNIQFSIVELREDTEYKSGYVVDSDFKDDQYEIVVSYEKSSISNPDMQYENFIGKNYNLLIKQNRLIFDNKYEKVYLDSDVLEDGLIILIDNDEDSNDKMILYVIKNEENPFQFFDMEDEMKRYQFE